MGACSIVSNALRDRAGDFPVVQYADDTILVMQACPVQAARMNEVTTELAKVSLASDDISDRAVHVFRSTA